MSTRVGERSTASSFDYSPRGRRLIHRGARVEQRLKIGPRLWCERSGPPIPYVMTLFPPGPNSLSKTIDTREFSHYGQFNDLVRPYDRESNDQAALAADASS